MENITDTPSSNTETSHTHVSAAPILESEVNTSLEKALGPLINQVHLLRESVNTVHADYADLKRTISKPKDEVKQELAHKIESNTQQLNTFAAENEFLRKENDWLKDRLAKIEQNQLRHNVITTGIQEGPFEPC